MRKKQNAVKKLAKLLDYILGRHPEEFGLIPDELGFVKIKELLKAVWEENGWRHVQKSHIMEVLLTISKPPIEIQGNNIRAVNRDNLPQGKPESDLPKLLYTCVRRRAYPHILEKGIFSAETVKTSLSASRDMAVRIGKRKDPNPVLLTVMVQSAKQKGVSFSTAGKDLFMCKFLPPGCFTGPPLPKEMPAQRNQSNTIEVVREKTPGSFRMEGIPETVAHSKVGGKIRKKEIAWKKGRRQLRKTTRRG